MKAIINKINGVSWACCGHCNHKLGKVINQTIYGTSNQAHKGLQEVKMEIKCSSCKTINELYIGGKEND